MSIDDLAAELTKSFESALVDDWMDDEGRKAVTSSIAEVLHAFFDAEIDRLKAELAEARKTIGKIIYANEDGFTRYAKANFETLAICRDFLAKHPEQP